MTQLESIAQINSSTIVITANVLVINTAISEVVFCFDFFL